jgi:cell division protein FtsB
MKRMQVDLGIWSKLTKVVVALLLVAGVMSLALWYLPLIQKNERYRKEIMRLDGEIQKQEASAKQTREAIETLRTDPKAVERLARELLGYAKPDETVVRFQPPQSNVLVH